MKKVSLLIPAYNAESFIGELIEKALSYSANSWHEVVVYDDASDDKTGNVASEKGATVIRGDSNRGSAYARNRLLEAATGDYVHFHDADDVQIHQSFLEKLSGRIGPETAAFCSWKVSEYNNEKEKIQSYNELENDWVEFFIQKHVHLNATIYPKQFLIENGGFDEEMRQQQDILLNIQMSAAGLEYQYVPQVLAEHHRRPCSTINSVEASVRERWALEVCKRCRTLHNRYHEAVARKALYHTRRLLILKDIEGARKGCTIAKKLGVNEISGRGKLVYLLSRVLGMMPAIWYQLWRSKENIRPPSLSEMAKNIISLKSNLKTK